ncbi:hypothetical protein Taro_038520 [Colocasia esculenta]|uniref:Cation-transporting P-type ATPase N-terminal domain-containing protein n=1 Tax=Colocasia esculenta TaxID=4460 RepID=A0A843WMG6_COLES|nr:hypothetical protein [Colocasia esculenta]
MEVSSLEDIRNETVDLERIPVEEVFAQLRCTKEGLTTEEGERRLLMFGPNKLEEKKESKFLKFLGFMWNPLSWVMESAAIMAIALANGGGKPPDYPDFIGIVILLLINSTISFMEENNAGNAAAALMAGLAPKTKVGRSTRLTCSWVEHIYTSCRGEIEAVVIATGVRTFFGKAAHLVDSTNNVGHFQKARSGIQEMHFLPFNPVEKRTAITYIDNSDGTWHRASKGAPEQVINMATPASSLLLALIPAYICPFEHQIIELCNLRGEVKDKAHAIIDKFAERGLRSLAVARQNVPEATKESPGGPWEFLGLLPLFDPPRHDSAETIRRALHLGVNVKMITGDQLAIAKETGRRLGMGTNMYPSSTLLGDSKDASVASLPVDELIEKADGFAGVFPEHKYNIVKKLQGRKHICGMTGDGVNDAPALKAADIGIAVADATDAARGASDIVLTEPGLSVIVSAVLTSRAIFQRMKNYTIYAVSITIRIVLGFLLIALIWKFDFSPFMVLIIAVLNDGTIMSISKDRVKPSPVPDSWKLGEIFAMGIVLGSYLAVMTVVFFWIVHDTDFFPDKFHVHAIRDDVHQLNSVLYLQVSIVSQALIFVTRSRSWSYVERPGLMLVGAFLGAQVVATLLAAIANLDFARIHGVGFGWAFLIWLYSIITYIPLDFIKFGIRYALSGKAWDNLLQNKTAFTNKKDYGRGEREAQWAVAQRTLHGLQAPDNSAGIFHDKNYRELSEIAEQARRRAEVARLRELHTLKGQVESVVKLKGLDIDTIQQHYTL